MPTGKLLISCLALCLAFLIIRVVRVTQWVLRILRGAACGFTVSQIIITARLQRQVNSLGDGGVNDRFPLHFICDLPAHV